MESQLADFKASYVRIGTEDGIPVGAGFLVSEGHVLTCAHVVAAALRDDTIEAQAEVPRGRVNLNFHFLRGEPHRTATVVHWQPRGGPVTNPSGDSAVLRLTENQPDEARPIRLTATNDLFGHGFRAHGFPRDTDSGVWAYGVVRDPLGNGWLQVEDTKEQGRRIEKGFSGGPVQDQATGRFVGMVAASSEYIKAAKVGYIIPTEVLVRTCSDLISLQERSSDVLFDVGHKQDDYFPNESQPLLDEDYNLFARIIESHLEMRAGQTNRLNRDTLTSAKLLVIPLPLHVRFTDDEIKDIRAYVRKGGRLLALSHHGGDPHHRTNLNDVLMGSGISTVPDTVMSTEDPLVRVTAFGSPGNTILGEGERVGMPLACSLELAPPAQAILQTSEDSNSYKIRRVGGSITEVDKGSSGSFVVGAVARYGNGRVAVLGSWTVFTEDSLNSEGFENRKFLLNLLRWLVGHDKDATDKK